MDEVETVVIGAGVVGLALAAELAANGREVLILEAESAFGTMTSARNSEVIHAGIYYPAGSLKARLCVEGRKRLYEWCAAHGVAHRKLGKLIVATAPDEIPGMEALAAKGAANGVEGLRLVGAEEARAMEPALACVAALHSPETGIVDSHGLMLSLLGAAEEAGAMLALNAPVERVASAGAGFEVAVGGDEPMRLLAREVANAAGHGAAALSAGIVEAPRTFMAKGNYFRLEGGAPFSRLIYPAPAPGGLGVHLTLDLGGAARFGPDVEWTEAGDYAVDPARADGFYDAIRRYWPDLPAGSLAPDYSGIRPKLSGPGSPAADFRIDGPEAHGVPGWLALYGIESPGLTAALAIAREGAGRLLAAG